MTQDIVKDNLSICVENNSCIRVLSANGEDIFSKVRIVQDAAGDKYLEVFFDREPINPLRVLSFGEVGSLFDTQIVNTQALENSDIIAEEIILDRLQLMDVENALDSRANFALCDGMGNVISATYVTKAELGDISTILTEIISQTNSIIGGS